MKLEIQVRNVYGNKMFYPDNRAASLFTQLANKKTLSLNDCHLIKLLGHEINFTNQ